jgi:predicted DNA-binding transcriptional regulator AlpA
MPHKHTRCAAGGIQNPPAADGEHRTSTPEIDRLAYRLAELAEALGVSRRTLERERSAGRFPPPDLRIGKAPLWRPGTVQAWIEDQSAAARKGVGR